MWRVPSASLRAQGDLPDVNVWLALLNWQHPHHYAARNYWEKTAAPRIGFCRVTMQGMLRLPPRQRARQVYLPRPNMPKSIAMTIA